jgi:hypothetical protein
MVSKRKEIMHGSATLETIILFISSSPPRHTQFELMVALSKINHSLNDAKASSRKHANITTYTHIFRAEHTEKIFSFGSVEIIVEVS